MKKYVLFLLALLILPSVFALEINIYVKSNFSQAEEIYFSYVLLSNNTEEIKYIPQINCPDGLSAILQEESVILSKNIPYIGQYADQAINGSLQPQTCIARIQIIHPYKITSEKAFRINGIPNIPIDLFVCKDSSCNEKSKTFNAEENVYLAYRSDLSNINLDVKLTYPDGNIENINLPYTKKFNQVGTYSLEITASKEGYATTSRKEEFGILEKNSIITKEIENNFSERKGEEVNTSNEVPKTYDSAGMKKSVYLILAGLIIIVLIIIIFIFYKFRNKKDEAGVIIR